MNKKTIRKQIKKNKTNKEKIKVKKKRAISHNNIINIITLEKYNIYDEMNEEEKIEKKEEVLSIISNKKIKDAYWLYKEIDKNS